MVLVLFWMTLSTLLASPERWHHGFWAQISLSHVSGNMPQNLPSGWPVNSFSGLWSWLACSFVILPWGLLCHFCGCVMTNSPLLSQNSSSTFSLREPFILAIWLCRSILLSVLGSWAQIINFFTHTRIGVSRLRLRLSWVHVNMKSNNKV